MNNLADVLQNRLAELKEVKSNLTTPHQIQGVYFAKKLGAKKPSEYAQVIKLYKLAPQIVESAYSWVIDYPNAHDLLRLFFWKYWDIKKSLP